MYVYSIKLPAHKQESDFETFEGFMLDEVFPAIDKSPRRDGQVTGLVLLRGGNPSNHNEYLLLVHEQGGAGAARQQLANSSGRSRLSAFGAQVSQEGDWHELDSWFAENAGTD
jgi:hypothetical protein